MNTNAFAPEFTSSIPEDKLPDKLTRWVLQRGQSDPRTYDRLVKLIRKRGIEIEDRPVNQSTADRALYWPAFKARGGNNPIILRSFESRMKKLPGVLAHELGHIEATRKPFPKFYFGLLDPLLGAGSVGMGLASIFTRKKGPALAGAILGGAHAVNRLGFEMLANARAKQILKEVTGEEQPMPSELRRALGVAGVSSIPAVVNLILAASK